MATRPASSVLGIDHSTWRAKRRGMEVGARDAGSYFAALYVLPDGGTMWHFSHNAGAYKLASDAAYIPFNVRDPLTRRLPRLAPFSMGHLHEIDFWK